MGNYINRGDVTNWAVGLSNADKDEIIARIELQLEELTRAHFYAKSFDLEMNGNNKNRIFPALHGDIITVTGLWICGIEADSTWYYFDTDSVYLDLCTSGAFIGDPELRYTLSQAEPDGLFPHGYNNIRITGTYGNSRLLALAKRACQIMIEFENDKSTHKRHFKMEWIGNYRYDLPGAEEGGMFYTGIRELDDLIGQLMLDTPILATP
jgi:hypothetical protein